MKKRPYKRNTVILNLRDDLYLSHDIDVEFWEDPSQEVVFSLINMVGSSKDDLENQTTEDINEFNKKYFDYVCLLLEDCSVEGIDFRTPESTEEAFYDKRISWGVFHLATIAYLSRLVDEYGILKKVLGRVGVLSNSGSENSKSEEE